MRKILNELVHSVPGIVLLRYHKSKILSICMNNEGIPTITQMSFSGVNIRVIVDGVAGDVCTKVLTKESIRNKIKEAYQAVLVGKGLKPKIYFNNSPMRGEFAVKETQAISTIPFEEKYELVRKTFEKLKKLNKKVFNASVYYYDKIEDKIIVTSHGADAMVHDAKCTFNTSVWAEDGHIKENGSDFVAVTGGWGELFRYKTPEQLIENSIKSSINKLNAEVAPAGMQTVVMEPSIVGLLAHEAIGHTVEADLVEAGAITKGKIGQKISSELVTLVDDPLPKENYAAAGVLLVDDEGNKPERVEIIKDGILRSYLHNSESAKTFGVTNTGNARACSFLFEPLIRMRNTYIEAGKMDPEEIISSTKNGIYLKGAGGGQADSNAEFLFSVLQPWKIENGKITKPLKEVTISGQAFNVLKSVDMLGNKVLFDMGAGFCGKGQYISVDGGGPVLRCKLKIGGRI